MRSKDGGKLRDIVLFVESYYERTGYKPTNVDIAEGVGMSRSAAQRYLVELANRGEIEYNRNGIITQRMTKSRGGSVNLPQVGVIACGSPILAEENIEEYVSIPEKWIGKGEFFILKASGESMINAGINSGDLVIVRKQVVAEQGQIVVALTADGEATLKRFYLRDGLAVLHPENDDMEYIVLDYCDIQGVVVKVIKDV